MKLFLEKVSLDPRKVIKPKAEKVLKIFKIHFSLSVFKGGVVFVLRIFSMLHFFAASKRADDVSGLGGCNVVIL